MQPQVPANGWEDIPQAGRMLFPVAPADVPEAAVRAVKRTLLRHPVADDPLDDDLARLVVAMVIAVLADRGDLDGAEAVASGYSRATGADVVITAK